MAIEGRCYTHLDDYKRDEWPIVFGAIPQKGDYVQSLSGGRMLRVHSITHSERGSREDAQPYILIELNK